MSDFDIVLMPNHTLRKKASTVAEINQEIKNISFSMLEAMYLNKGIGLAANQVNILQRIIVIDLQENDVKNPMIMINPEIISHSDTMVDSEEGCLSIPDMKDTIKRYESIVVKYLDLDNKPQTIEAKNLLCYCLQHEIDHLNGILFIDHLSNLKKNFLLKKYNKSRQKNK